MSLGKNVKRIRLNGGDDFWLKISSTWTNLGKTIKGIVEDMTDSTEVVFADGDSTELDGQRKVKITITLGQTSKEELELVDSLRDATFECVTGTGKLEGKNQAIYFKEIKPIPKMNLEFPGSPVQLVFEASVIKQAAVVSVTPSTGFPAGIGFTGASLITGKNNYYVIVEETPA